MPERELAFTRAILVISLLGASLFLLLIVFSEVYNAQRYLPLFVGSLGAALVAWFLVPPLGRRGVPLGIFLGLGMLNLFVLVPELALRAFGFRYESGIEFGYPRPSVFLSYVPDEKLFWKLDADRPEVNSLGFPGREPEVPKPPGVFRVLFLGDSCTQQGYPRVVELCLRSEPGATPEAFECVTLAVAGYSSHQGRVLAELYGERLDPDVVVVYFGWNDHWRAWGAIDSEKTVTVEGGRSKGPLRYLYHRSRVIQSLVWIAEKIRGVRSEPLDEVRVPIAEYRDNLVRIREIFAGRGTPVLFLTAPTSHYRLGVPDYLVEWDYVRDKETAVDLHRRYNETVREVATGARVRLVDLERTLDRSSDEDLRAIFSLDGIHLTERGLAVIANLVTGAIDAGIAETAPPAAP